jgi:hypothetical protein
VLAPSHWGLAWDVRLCSHQSPGSNGLADGNSAAPRGSIIEAATVGELAGSLSWGRSGLSLNGIDLGESVGGEVCVTDGPNESALAVDDRDAFDGGGPKRKVRCLDGCASVEDHRVGRHHVRD